MSDFITVKKIGDDEVRIIEDTQKKWSWRCSVAWLLSLLGSILTGALILILTLPEQVPFPYNYFIMILPGIAYLETAFIWYENLAFDHAPTYNVFLRSDVMHSTTILKTGTDADQIAICKAVKKYEKIAQDRENDKTRLREIAGNCK